MRPNGRCLDHYRIALDGTVLEAQVVITSVFRAPVLAKYRLMYQSWVRDLKIRRTAWVVSYLAITTNNILVSMDDKGDAVPPEEIKNVFASIKEMSMKSMRKSASTRYAVVAGLDGRMWLEHQVLPGTAEALTSKPTFAG